MFLFYVMLAPFKILISIFVLTFYLSDGKAQSIINSNWEITSEWFGQDTVKMRKTDAKGKAGIFKFTDYGSVLHLVDADMSCKVGLFQIYESQWHIDHNILTLNIKGQKTTEHFFHYFIRYNIAYSSENEMVLIAKEIIAKIEVSDWEMTWDEFLSSKTR